MPSNLFRTHGEFCTNHPWEVIVATLTLTVCMLTFDQHSDFFINSTLKSCNGCNNEVEQNIADIMAMTFIRCLAVLCYYYQFRKLLGSKYILGIAGLFTVFSSFIFTTTVLNILKINASDLKDALFFFLLLIDLNKIALLARFALNAKNQNELRSNIAKGLAVLGPVITLDTVVETLVIGVGTLSGVQRLEMLSWFGCFSVLINYIVFMTVYPACLSLILELSGSTWLSKTKESLMIVAFKDEDNKPNPVVQRVKLIMSFGLMLVHAHSHWSLKDTKVNTVVPFMHHSLNRTEETDGIQNYHRWLTLSTEYFIILIPLVVLIIKFLLFEDREDYTQLHQYISEKTCENPKPNTPMFNLSDDEPLYVDKEVQTSNMNDLEIVRIQNHDQTPCRSLEDCLKVYNDMDLGATALSDEEIILLIKNKKIASYQLEKAVDNPERGVGIRRKILGKEFAGRDVLNDLPFKNYDYSKVMGACCENVIGYMPVPVGYAGPLRLDSKEYYVPMATTEGCLIASTNRGCRALRTTGIVSSIIGDGMTRGPIVRFASIIRASQVKKWMDEPANFAKMKHEFDCSSRFARLQKLTLKIAGRNLFIRFVATTGDAMGMNMLSKGTECSLKYVQNVFPDMEILSLSGNFCTDKKSAAINWIEGRGKSVVCEAIVPAKIITTILKTNVHALVDVNQSKNLVGSAVSGSLGGFNAHAANVVTAIFIATGQDPAQNVSSCNCMTLMEPWGPSGEDLYISCTMPSIEIGTVGGGTILPAQGACLDMLGVKGANLSNPGANACQLAKIVCATVLAGELSLMSALTAGHLVKSHLRHNRSTTTLLEAYDRRKNAYLPPCKDNI